MAARILVIEDNVPNLELMCYLLRAHGYTVLEARNGQEGVEAALRERPALVICDLQLPIADGFSVMRKLRAAPEFGPVPFIAVTAFAMVGDREKVLAAGFDGYISKPITPETFSEEVGQFLPPEERGQQQSGPSSEPAGPEAPRFAAPGSRGTILAVDNLASNLSVVRYTLEPLGYEVITAGSVAQALELLKKCEPDLILSDMHMPAQTGHDFLITVRADARLQHIPFVILCSTTLSREQRLALGRCSPNRILERPVEPSSLIAEVEACLAKRES